MCDPNDPIVRLACFPTIFGNLLQAVSMFSGIVAVIFILIGGLRFITSGGDQAKVASARKTLTFAVVGLIIVVSAYFMINFLADITKSSCLKQLGFNC